MSVTFRYLVLGGVLSALATASHAEPDQKLIDAAKAKAC